MKKVFYILAFILLAVYSYNGYQWLSNTKLVVYPEGKLSSFTENVRAIPLETTAECRIHKIEKVRMADDYLFVASEGRLFQFSDSGEYIQEITSSSPLIMDYAIDPNRQWIVTIEKEYMARYYDFHGRQIGCLNLTPHTTWDKFHKIDFYHDSLWLTADLLSTHPSDPEIQCIETHICRFDIEFNKLESHLLSPANTGRYSNGFFSTPEPAVTDTGEIYAFSPSLEPEQLLEDTLFIAKMEIPVRNGVVKSGNIYPVRRSGRFMLANYSNRTNNPAGYSFCYDTKENKAYYSTEGFTDDIFQTGQIGDLCALNMLNTEFCFVKGSQDAQHLFPERAELDNPIVFVFNLKA